ncbi:MAG TPA: hypothetical protein VG929_12310 [Actinomycetota bacterium]|nr:hypothetical protein [Actinomycetota bacterium]
MTAPEWSALAAWVTAALLFGSLIFAGMQIHQARRLREEQSRPFVVVDFDAGRLPVIDLTVQNVGATMARNVRMTFDPPLERAIEKKDRVGRLANSSLIQNGLPTLPPGKEIRTFFDMSFERVSSDLPTKYKVRITYDDFRGRRLDPDEYVLDLGMYKDLEFIVRKGAHEAAKALEEIHKEMKRWTKGLNGLHVYTSDSRSSDRRSHRWMRSQRILHSEASSKLRRRLEIGKNKVLDRLSA